MPESRPINRGINHHPLCAWFPHGCVYLMIVFGILFLKIIGLYARVCVHVFFTRVFESFRWNYFDFTRAMLLERRFNFYRDVRSERCCEHVFLRFEIDVVSFFFFWKLKFRFTFGSDDHRYSFFFLKGININNYILTVGWYKYLPRMKLSIYFH